MSKTVPVGFVAPSYFVLYLSVSIPVEERAANPALLGIGVYPGTSLLQVVQVVHVGHGGDEGPSGSRAARV